MQSPHSFDPDPFSHLGITPPPPSLLSVQMPNVVVVPPEEEHAETPPFLYFDASKAVVKSTTPDLETLDIALDVHQQMQNTAPIFRRTNVSEETVVMPRKGAGMTFVPPTEWQYGTAHVREPDDDVVEVIKVRKYEGVSNAGPVMGQRPLSRTKTFKSRATQAFRSIKNAGKSNRKPSMQEARSSVDENGSMDVKILKQTLDEVPSQKQAGLSRRKSRALSQIFHFGRDTPSESAAVSGTRSPTPPSSSASLRSMRSSISRPYSSASHYATPATLPTDSLDTRSFSPNPSVSTRGSRISSFRKRLSILELPKLFSSSASITSSSTGTSDASLPSPPTSSSDESLEPEIAFTAQQHHILNSHSMPHSWTSSSLDGASDLGDDEEVDYGEVLAPSLSMVREEDSRWDDLSLEMRLDSLHFDSLSFDPNDFTLTSFKDVHRNNSRIAVV